MIFHQTHRARSCRQLPGRRASQMHGSNAVCTREAAVEAAATAEGSRWCRRAAMSAPRHRHNFLKIAPCNLTLLGNFDPSFIPLILSKWLFWPLQGQNFLRLRRAWKGLRLGERAGQPKIGHPNHHHHPCMLQTPCARPGGSRRVVAHEGHDV